MVEVSVMDLNDNPPMFVNQPYYAVVSKEAARDSQGMQMEIVQILIIEELIDKIMIWYQKIFHLQMLLYYCFVMAAVHYFFLLLNVPGTYYQFGWALKYLKHGFALIWNN
jgi:hypothetical protein